MDASTEDTPQRPRGLVVARRAILAWILILALWFGAANAAHSEWTQFGFDVILGVAALTGILQEFPWVRRVATLRVGLVVLPLAGAAVGAVILAVHDLSAVAALVVVVVAVSVILLAVRYVVRRQKREEPPPSVER